MDRDTIIQLAREVWGQTAILPTEDLERFAALIAAHEREACARMCEAYMAEGIGREMAAAIRSRA